MTCVEFFYVTKMLRIPDQIIQGYTVIQLNFDATELKPKGSNYLNLPKIFTGNKTYHMTDNKSTQLKPLKTRMTGIFFAIVPKL